jgi:hypothetical protein
MSAFSATTPSRAWGRVEPALARTARALGTAAPAGRLRDVLRATFALPAHDERYGENALEPGALPLELSFAERTPGLLRFDVEPFGPEVTPAQRREETFAVAGAVARDALGAHAATVVEAWSARVPYPSGGAFGAFLGASLDAAGVVGVTVYSELAGAAPPALGREAAALAGCVPHFFAVAVAARGPATRLYVACRDELRLLSLEPFMRAHGLGDRFPAFATAVLHVTGGLWTLPAESALIGLRAVAGGLELKLELFGCALPEPERRGATIARMLAPPARAAYARWRAALGEPNPGIVSVRVAPGSAPALNLYAVPAWL